MGIQHKLCPLCVHGCCIVLIWTELIESQWCARETFINKTIANLLLDAAYMLEESREVNGGELGNLVFVRVRAG